MSRRPTAIISDAADALAEVHLRKSAAELRSVIPVMDALLEAASQVGSASIRGGPPDSRWYCVPVRHIVFLRDTLADAGGVA